MDLYDLENYFATYVPTTSLQSPLLLCAAAAIAAKQLGRVKGVKAIPGGVCNKQAATETYPNSDQTDWFYVAVKYYDKAIEFLRAELAAIESHGARHASLLTSGESIHRVERARTSQADNLLVATSILSVYEFMDDSGIDWSR